MDPSIEDKKYEKSNGQRGGLVVELVGVAGVGKSTLFKSLDKKGFPWLSCEYSPPVWKISTAQFYIKNVFLLIPTFIRMLGNGDRLLKRREIAFMAILNGWHEELQKRTANSSNIIVLDQGPISIIAYLNVWGPKSLFNSNMNEWWEKIYGKWIYGVDMVILMDTSDEKIKWRINNRPQDHHLKGESDSVTLEWITKYRNLYEKIVYKLLATNDAIRILRLDSGNNSVDALVNTVLHEFNMEADKIDQ
jgi:predicted ATPase